MGLSKKGGALFVKAGVTRLSELIIDADKDWLDFAMTNVKELAENMQRGDMLYRSGFVLTKLIPGRIGDSLVTMGSGKPPVWRPVRPRHPTAGILPASNITLDEARLNGIVVFDNGDVCERRFRYREVGAPGYDYTDWAGHHLTGDTFYEDITGLNPATDYEFQCQLRNIAGEGLWSDMETFTTL